MKFHTCKNITLFPVLLASISFLIDSKALSHELRVISEKQNLQDSYIVASSFPTFDHKRFARSTVENYLGKIPDFEQRTEYFYKVIDLNNDGIREVIIVVFSPVCGAWECSGYVLQKQGVDYRVIGKIGVQSSGREIVAIQQSVTKGFVDITTQIYDPNTRISSWKIHKFDGNNYRNTYQNSRPSKLILNVKKGSGLKL